MVIRAAILFILATSAICVFDERDTVSSIKSLLVSKTPDSLADFLLSQPLSSQSGNLRISLQELFRENYPLLVQSIHKIPTLCQWVWADSNENIIKHCPRQLGLHPDISDPKDPYSKQVKLDYGFIARDRLEIVDVTNLETVHQNCPDNVKIFQSCKNQLSTVKVLMSEDRSDLQPWSMRRAVVITDNPLEKLQVFPELSRPFAPHLVAVKNSFVSAWGYIFDFEKWYIHGGCSDRAWHHPTFDYDLSTHTVVSFKEPVLSMIHPFPSMFYHEYIEMHAMFLMALPLLKAMPNITILINKPLVHTKLFPLLRALDIDLSNYNIISLKDPASNRKSGRRPTTSSADVFKMRGNLIYAPYVITPISLWCQYISRTTTKLMRKKYSERLPYWNTNEPANGIIVYDRYNLRPKRFLAEGFQIYNELNFRYGSMRSVKMYFGNESLEETIRLFRTASVFVAAHGGGQANMIFMPEGGLVVEVRPENWPVPCYIDIADNLDLKHYLYVVKDIGRIGEMHVDLQSFLPVIYNLIDQDKTATR